MIPSSLRAGRAIEHRVRIGNFEARKSSAGRTAFGDPYRLAVALTWPRFIIALISAEFVLNVVFALLYLLQPGAIANARPGSITDAFFFSIETLATVGYGEMYPADLYGHVISAVEIVTGVGFIAVITGLIFVRVSRPRPCFRYADTIVLTRHLGKLTLMIRVASDHLSILYDAEARLSVLIPGRMDEEQPSRSVVGLPLVRDGVPVLALSWTLMHVIDEASPLAGLDSPAMVAAGLRLFLTMRAEDATLSTTVRDLRAYDAVDIKPGRRYANALSISDDGLPVLDLDRLSSLEPDSAPVGHDLFPQGRTDAAKEES